MITSISGEERELIRGHSSKPCVTIILPVRVNISMETELGDALLRSAKRVEEEMGKIYPADQSIPVLRKLQHLVENFEFNKHARGVALFVSPEVEKVFHLYSDVKEKIVIDDSFEIRDLIYNRKATRKTLVLSLSLKKSSIYLSQGHELVEIPFEESDAAAYINDMPERVANFSDPSKRKEILSEKYLHHIDKRLTDLTASHQVPVLVLGTRRIMGQFKKITRNEKLIRQFIHGNFETTSKEVIRRTIEKSLDSLGKIQQEQTLSQLVLAKGEKKLVSGINDVWASVSDKNNRLLVVEKDYICPLVRDERSKLKFADAISPRQDFYTNDAVDDIIEKVLQSGGEVEFVDNGSLQEYGRIALIKYY